MKVLQISPHLSKRELAERFVHEILSRDAKCRETFKPARVFEDPQEILDHGCRNDKSVDYWCNRLSVRVLQDTCQDELMRKDTHV